MINSQDQQLLLKWFYEKQRKLPWRENPTPYRVWISEIMLQQTTVATVINYYNRFMDRFPNLSSLAKADETELLTLWAGLGYYSRARNILKTAQIIQEEENFPQDYKELLKLPGIGVYTAGAICSIAWNQAVSLIDTNVDRVLGRYFALNRKDSDFEQVLRSHAQKTIETVSQKDLWAWNQALMELGALCCGVKKVDCSHCPLQHGCQALLRGTPLTFPGDKIKAPITEIVEYALVIKKDNKMIFAKNIKGSRRRGMYDFPVVPVIQGQEIERVSYRISNNKVLRIYCAVEYYEYKLLENDLLLDQHGLWETYPLTSPCKKFLIKSSILK